jgi:hypothetical protein
MCPTNPNPVYIHLSRGSVYPPLPIFSFMCYLPPCIPFSSLFMFSLNCLSYFVSALQAGWRSGNFRHSGHISAEIQAMLTDGFVVFLNPSGQIPGRPMLGHYCFLLESNSYHPPIENYVTIQMFIAASVAVRGHAVASLVEALCYKPGGRGFDSR